MTTLEASIHNSRTTLDDVVYDSVLDSVCRHIRQIVSLHVRHYTGNSAPPRYSTHQAVYWVSYEKIKSYDT
jgi:hypothetical protein